MTPRTLLATADEPGGAPLRLVRHDRDFMILLERNELMSTRMNGSEEALGTIACARLAGRAAPKVLIGGYGMGFTLRAVLARLGPDARVTVAELVPAIVDWARGPMAPLTAGCLDDPRVTLWFEDVAATMARDGWDAILLDVDNGPDGVTREGNDGLYTAVGLAKARTALTPGGVLAIWSAAPDPAFARRLGTAGLAVDEVRVRARQNGKGPQHTIWFATRPQ